MGRYGTPISADNLWLAVRDCIPTAANLHHQCIGLIFLCPFYGLQQESTNHIFNTSPFAEAIWNLRCDFRLASWPLTLTDMWSERRERNTGPRDGVV